MKIVVSAVAASALCLACGDKNLASDEDPKPEATQGTWPKTAERAETVKTPPPEQVEPQPEAVAQITGPDVSGVVSGADDLQSQPSGAAGSRVACGVIEKRDDDAS